MRATSFYREFRKRYPVIVKATVIGGVAVEIFEPVEGLTPRNERRVLINLHGGHFKEGWGWINQMESIPIASLGKFRVVSVDYRHAPEARFPAASEDVTKVYRALLAQYKPQSIGMFGCSAGGLLTAQAVAWFQKTDLPAVGAIGIFGAGASYYQEGDSVRQALAISGREIESPSKHPYFGPATTKDPFAFPILSPDILGKFPPSIIISSTRDLALSAAVHTHTRLTALGRSSELYVWEGMGHCFFNGSAFSQTDEAHRTVTHFFDQALAM